MEETYFSKLGANGQGLQMNMVSGTRFQRILLGVTFAIFALYCDNASLGASRAHFQEALWTSLIVAEFAVELRRTLKRARPALLALSLLFIHFYFMYSIRDRLPFNSSLVIFLLALLEFGVFTVVYLRLCQAINPNGPFGLTAAEKERKKNIVRLT
jgi:hypothetical protein